MKQILALTLMVALAACAAPTRREPTASAPSQTSIIAPNFGDADPHPQTASAGRHPVHGVDVSRFQTAVDWHQARANGVNFAFIKATEGGDQVDPMFRDHWRGAAQAGIPRGAYHFFYHCRPAIEQARWFIAHVPRAPGSLPPVLDMEWTPFSPTCTTRRDGAVIRAEAMVFANAIEAHYGQRPILYTSVDFFEDAEMWKLDGVEFWLRSVAAHPRDRYDGHHWTFWQYTSTGLVPGITGKADINAFAGGAGAWGDWLARRRVN
jgi:lysozyme